MKYNLFLFDADDTLFNFGKSEEVSLKKTLFHFDATIGFEEVYQTYKKESEKLWRMLELGKTTKDHLRVERFRLTAEKHDIQVCPEKLSDLYLEILPEQVNLNDHANEMCEYLANHYRVGIVTNGIESVQKRRLEKSGLSKFIEFMVVSEECGFAKPDIRFFEHTMSKFTGSSKEKSLVIGDRLETDNEGAHAFGIDACWYNPKKLAGKLSMKPKYQIECLSEIKKIVNEF